MRVYLPLTLTTLPVVLAAGEIGPAPLTGYAVTPALREWYAEGDTEEMEYVAMTHAAAASLRMLAAESGAPARRLVLAADVADATVRPAPADEPDRAAVLLTAPVPLGRVAAAHLDEPDAAEVVRSAIEALPAADAGDEDARFLLDEAEARELLWYDATELTQLPE